MSYLDKYIALSTGYGSTISAMQQNTMVRTIGDDFTDSPFYASITIDGITTDVRIVETADKDSVFSSVSSDIKRLLFRPQTTQNRGAIAVIGSYNWMIMDFWDNAIFPKSTINRCSQVLKWKDVGGVAHSYPCTSKLLSPREEKLKTDKIFDTPFNENILLVKYDANTKIIVEKQRFLFNQKAYRVIGIDDTTNVFSGVGYMNLVIEKTESNAKDDTVNGYADNSAIYGGGGHW